MAALTMFHVWQGVGGVRATVAERGGELGTTASLGACDARVQRCDRVAQCQLGRCACARKSRQARAAKLKFSQQNAGQFSGTEKGLDFCAVFWSQVCACVLINIPANMRWPFSVTKTQYIFRH